MTLLPCPFRLLISVCDSGCTTVYVITVVCLGTALSLSFQPVTQADAVFLVAAAVAESQWRSHLTGRLFSARPDTGRWW